MSAQKKGPARLNSKPAVPRIEIEKPLFLRIPIEPVNIVRLKNFAAEKLSRQSALREVLLREDDHISSTDFVARLPIWLALLGRKEEGPR